jgi:hypothetical protein
MPANTQPTNCIPCGIQTFRRNNYFNGKLLVKRDFVLEQEYMIGKDWLHNNLLHGVGTVCGLKVVQHPNPACRDEFVVIQPGLALDCCGREIIVKEPIIVPVLQTVQDDAELSARFGEEREYDLFIALCYKEEWEEKIPVLLPDCDCDDNNQAYNRIRETSEWKIFAQRHGTQLPARLPNIAKLDWLSTIPLLNQSPRAITVDTQFQQMYVAAQALPEAEEDPATLGARLFVYRSDNQDIITALDGGRAPTDLVVSLLGDLIFLAASGLAGGGGEEQTGIAIFREGDLRSEDIAALVIGTAGPARLLISPMTGDLFVLELGGGQLLRYRNNDLRDWVDADGADPAPVPETIDLAAAFDSAAGAAIWTITPDGRYVFIAQRDENRVRVIDVAAMAEINAALDALGVPVALATSTDSAYLTVLWQDGTNAILARYALETSGMFGLRPEGRQGIWEAQVRDLAVSPDERWAYVLQDDAGQGRVQTLAIDAINRAGGGIANLDELLGESARVSGIVHFQRLVALTGRLYIASDEDAEASLTYGRVAIFNVTEAACADTFYDALDGCTSCGDTQDQCVVLAHIPRYGIGEPILDTGGDTGDEAETITNVIDNLTFRPIVPSVTSLYEVIRCMIEQGLGEGRVGPRGPAGETGAPGVGIELRRTDTHIQWRQEDDSPSWTDLIALDELRGDPGPGVEMRFDAATRFLQWRPIGAAIWRDLVSIDEFGGGANLDLAHIDAISWVHDGVLAETDGIPPGSDGALVGSAEEAFKLLNSDNGLGLVIHFDRKIDFRTVVPKRSDRWTSLNNINNVFQLFAYMPDESGQLREILVLDTVVEACVVQSNTTIHNVTYADAPEVNVISRADRSDGADIVEAIRLRLTNMPNFINAAIEKVGFATLRVVLHGDFVLDERKQPIDANHIGLQSGSAPHNGRPGNVFESWFFIGQPGD